jgi:hypothetical protein
MEEAIAIADELLIIKTDCFYKKQKGAIQNFAKKEFSRTGKYLF